LLALLITSSSPMVVKVVIERQLKVEDMEEANYGWWAVKNNIRGTTSHLYGNNLIIRSPTLCESLWP
jgi:hypothetical protein